MNIQSILQLLVLVGELESEGDVVAHLERLVHGYGFDFYALIYRKRQDDPEDVALAEHWPEGWQAVYKARHYALIDPTARMLGVLQRPFRWRSAVTMLTPNPHRARMERMMQEAIRYGMHDGYVFPVHGRSGLLGSLTLSGRSRDLSPSEMWVFDAAAKAVFWRLLELRGEAQTLETAVRLDAHLTRRELEVIGLLADGLTSNEIARMLSLSSHTVDWYINGLQEKLQAKNRQHVVAMAFRLGLAK